MKIYKILLLITLISLFCGCSDVQDKEAFLSGESESSKIQSEDSKETPEIDYGSLIFCENGKYGIYAQNSNVMIPAKYDDIYYYGQDGIDGFYVLTLCENAEESIYFVTNDGTFINEEPSDGFYVYPLDYDSSIDILVFTANGSQWTYAVNTETGKAKFIHLDYPKILTEIENGYFIFMQFSNGKQKDLGVINSDGKLITEAIYQKIDIPFPDRFLLYSGDVWDGIEFALCSITDNKGNVINSSFNLVQYKVFDDGSYIGVGTSAGKYASVPCYDENGNIRDSGCWFVDKDGNALSGRIDYFYCNPQEISPDGIISATDENGNAVEIKASDYICRP